MLYLIYRLLQNHFQCVSPLLVSVMIFNRRAAISAIKTVVEFTNSKVLGLNCKFIEKRSIT